MTTTPTYNLKVVVKETGLKPDTIRAWERRYGLPSPGRSKGGHRLYSQRDIDTLKWLVARKAEGLSISKATQLWEQLAAEDQDPLRAMPLPAASSTQAVVGGETLTEMRSAWVQACLAFDERAAEQIAAQAFAQYPVETVCFELLQGGLAAVGDRWYEGEATVQQEHFASELAMRRLEALVASSPSPIRAGRILVGCATEDTHAFPALLLTLLLRRRGWGVVYLGADVPLARLERTVQAVKPEMVVLSAQHIHSASKLKEMAVSLLKSDHRMAYGGQIFNRVPALRDKIPGEFLGDELKQAPERLDQLMQSRALIPAPPEPGDALQQTIRHFRDRQGSIETSVWAELSQREFRHADVVIANLHLGRGILAALNLGDLSFLEPDLEWIKQLIGNYGLNGDQLKRYLRTYSRAAAQHLGQPGERILGWLEQVST